LNFDALAGRWERIAFRGRPRAEFVVMDEPTIALGRTEVERRFANFATLKASGCCIIYISHTLEEINRLATGSRCCATAELDGGGRLPQLPVDGNRFWRARSPRWQTVPRRLPRIDQSRHDRLRACRHVGRLIVNTGTPP
jgi:hypothetical protein